MIMNHSSKQSKSNSCRKGFLMLGAIVGDIVGSIYERNNIKTKDFPLFGEGCHFTDDTVMTIATADALLHGNQEVDFIDAYKKWGKTVSGRRIWREVCPLDTLRGSGTVF